MARDLDPLYEKRKLKRRHLIYYLRVFNNLNGELVGHMVDITEEGVMLISEQPIDIGTEIEMRMQLPFEILERNELTFSATCQWCKKDVNPDFYASGYSFTGLPMNDVVIIESLIQRYGFMD
jgi:hypothetical protein